MNNKYDNLVQLINDNKKIQKEELDNKLLLIENKINFDYDDELFDELSFPKFENFDEDEKNKDKIDEYIQIEDNIQSEIPKMESENISLDMLNPSLNELHTKSKEKEVSKKDYTKVKLKKINFEKKYYKGEEVESPRDETIKHEQKKENVDGAQKNGDSRKSNSKEVIRRDVNDSQNERNAYDTNKVNITEEESGKKPPKSYIKLINSITNEIGLLETLFKKHGKRKKKKRKKKGKKEGEYNNETQK